MDLNASHSATNLSCTLPHEISDHQIETYSDFSWWLEGFGAVLIGSCGTILNTTSIIVLLGSALRASFFNWLLACLALFDNLFLLNGILEALRNHLGSVPLHDYVFVMFLFPFRSVVLCCSMYMTVILALERYIALVRPTLHQPHQGGPDTFGTYFRCHFMRLIKYVGPVVFLSSVYYLPRWMELQVVETDVCSHSSKRYNCSRQHEVKTTKLRQNNEYVLWYLNISNLIVTAIIPLLSLMYLNFNIYVKFKQYLQRQPSLRPETNASSDMQLKVRKREKDMVQQTMILFVIVILFGLSHVLRIALNIEEFISLEDSNNARANGCDWIKFWTYLASPISHVLLLINSSINFFIYCFFNPSFRDVLVSKTITALDKLSFVKKRNINRNVRSQANLENAQVMLTLATNRSRNTDAIDIEDNIEDV